MQVSSTPPLTSLEAAGLHPAPRRHPVPGVPVEPWGAEAAVRAAQRVLRAADAQSEGLGHAGRTALLQLALDSLQHLQSADYSPAYQETFAHHMRNGLKALAEAHEAHEARMAEAEKMRERGQRELARYEAEAQRLESYAERYRNVRLADARFK